MDEAIKDDSSVRLPLSGGAKRPSGDHPPVGFPPVAHLPGGEMSRFMLAIKVVMAETGSEGTLIFDEVDAGVGGAVALQADDPKSVWYFKDIRVKRTP